MADDELFDLIPGLQPTLRSYEYGYCLAHSNEVADKMFIIRDGEVSSQHVTFSGHVYIASTYFAGDLIGPNGFYSSPARWPLSYITQRRSTILTFSMKPFMPRENHSDSPKERFCRALLEARIDEENKWMIRKISRAASGTREKILTYFDLMQDKYGKNTFLLRMSREDLANYLDVGRSTLFRELKRLSDDGLVTIDGNRMVTVDNQKLGQLRFRDD
jgi:CRP-like cAMP-binding protein